MIASATRALTIALAAAVALTLPATARAQVPAAVQATVDGVLAKPLYRNTTWGLLVQDAATGETLYERNADLMYVPGSIFKSYATSAALQTLGPDHRFVTPVHRRGRVVRRTLRGDLVLVGSGDFSFGLRDDGDQLAFTDFDHHEANGLDHVGLVPGNPLSGVDELAREVRASGIRRVRGDVVVDARLFRRFDGFPEGVLSPIWVNENVIDVTTRAAAPGKRPSVSWRPRTAAYRVVNRATTGPADSENTLSVDQTAPRTLTLTGSIPAGPDPSVRIFKIPDPASFARTAFVEALRRAGVRVDARATGANPERLLPGRGSYRASTRVAQRTSPPLSQYVRVIQKVSFNRGANLMLCLMAVQRGSRDCLDGLITEREVIDGLGVGPDSTFVFDGAGSFETDRTTPRDMNAFLRNVLTKPYAGAFVDSLPVLGVDGSLAETLRDSPARGKVRLKTGTRADRPARGTEVGVMTAQTMTGYADAESGRRLALSVMANGIPITGVDGIFTIFTDQATIAAAFQQGY